MSSSSRSQDESSSPSYTTANRELQSDSLSGNSSQLSVLWIALVVAATVVLSVLLVTTLFPAFASVATDSHQDLLLHTVSRGDYLAEIIERGEIQDGDDEVLTCEVDAIPGDDVHGTAIVWIVPNGCSVKEGDLIVALDHSQQRERLDRQILLVDRARSMQVFAKSEYDYQQTKNANALVDAGWQVEMAELDVEMFVDPRSGIHAKTIAEIQIRIHELEREVRKAEDLLKRNKAAWEDLEQNSQQPVEEPGEPAEVIAFKRSMERERSLVELIEAESEHSKKANELLQAKAELTREETLCKKQGEFQRRQALERTRRTLVQLKRNEMAEVAQKKAALDAANQAFEKHEELLARYRKQLEKCKVYAPADGMVVYSDSGHRSSRIRQGAVVRKGQRILSLSDLQHLQVAINIQQEVLSCVTVGPPVVVRALAYPGRIYRGTVQSVSVLPEMRYSVRRADRGHRVIVDLDGDLTGLLPGMSAFVEIRTGQLKGAMIVPETSLVQQNGQHWCYVSTEHGIELRPVELGRRINQGVEIRQGLREGEPVVLAPQQIGD